MTSSPGTKRWTTQEMERHERPSTATTPVCWPAASGEEAFGSLVFFVPGITPEREGIGGTPEDCTVSRLQDCAEGSHAASQGAFICFCVNVHFVCLGVLPFVVTWCLNFVSDVRIFFSGRKEHAHCCNVCAFSHPWWATTVRRALRLEACTGITQWCKQVGMLSTVLAVHVFLFLFVEGEEECCNGWRVFACSCCSNVKHAFVSNFKKVRVERRAWEWRKKKRECRVHVRRMKRLVRTHG